MGSVRIGSQTFAGIDEARYFIRELLAKYPIGTAITNPDDAAFLADLLRRHPVLGEKLAGGFRALVVVRNRKRKATEVKAELPDGSTESFGWIDCLDGVGA